MPEALGPPDRRRIFLVAETRQHDNDYLSSKLGNRAACSTTKKIEHTNTARQKKKNNAKLSNAIASRGRKDRFTAATPTHPDFTNTDRKLRLRLYSECGGRKTADPSEYSRWLELEEKDGVWDAWMCACVLFSEGGTPRRAVYAALT